MSSNVGGGWHGHIALKVTSEEYVAQTGFSFLPPHNLGNYPPTTGNAQDQALRTEKFQKKQAMFRKYTPVEIALKNQVITAVEPVFLSPLVDQIIGSRQISALTILHNLLLIYGIIDAIDLEEKTVKMMGPYDHVEPLAQFIEQLEKGREFEKTGGQKIYDTMMVSKGITLLAQT